jgi:hypothetical protein
VPQRVAQGILAMKAIRSITPREAKAVWDSLKSPSARTVARAMTQAGRRVHHSTIARWCARDWRPMASGEHPVEAAREALDIAARLLTGDPGGGVEVLERYAKGNERFEGLTEQELLRRATRELLIAQIVVAEVFCLHAPMLPSVARGHAARHDTAGPRRPPRASGPAKLCRPAVAIGPDVFRDPVPRRRRGEVILGCRGWRGGARRPDDGARGRPSQFARAWANPPVTSAPSTRRAERAEARRTWTDHHARLLADPGAVLDQ